MIYYAHTAEDLSENIQPKSPWKSQPSARASRALRTSTSSFYTRRNLQPLIQTANSHELANSILLSKHHHHVRTADPND